MTRDHNAEHSSRSPRHDTFSDAAETHVQALGSASQHPPLACRVPSFSMPSVGFLQSLNKGSVKFNSGFRYSSCDNLFLQDKTTVGLLPANKPTVVLDFGQLFAPVVTSEFKPSTGDLVQLLAHPPAHAFVYGTLSIQWVLGAVGKQHFRFRVSDERYVLTPEADLRKRGAALGLPVYCTWSGLMETTRRSALLNKIVLTNNVVS
ncbi:hypothetical protein DE146DRAFT_631055 [Phaeosphaeria sp. MPI-PUGE-AT-0046c]|nr:hypothetical protein DE146DRAFT_631055 [Phaeosphaeria sp. MPI-PUGE-AT-0046c]